MHVAHSYWSSLCVTRAVLTLLTDRRTNSNFETDTSAGAAPSPCDRTPSDRYLAPRDLDQSPGGFETIPGSCLRTDWGRHFTTPSQRRRDESASHGFSFVRRSHEALRCAMLRRGCLMEVDASVSRASRGDKERKTRSHPLEGWHPLV